MPLAAATAAGAASSWGWVRSRGVRLSLARRCRDYAIADNGRETGPSSIADGSSEHECHVNRVLRVAYDGLRMVKADLVHRVMEAVDLNTPAAQDAVDALLECIGFALERGDRVVLRRFGTFHAAPRKTGVARNPRTNELVAMPRGRVVRFRPSADLRNLPGDG